MKKVRVIFSPEAEQVYTHPNESSPSSKIDRSILNAINKKVELIKANIHYGEPIAKRLIPEEYKTKYEAIFSDVLKNSKEFLGHQKSQSDFLVSLRSN